MIEVSLERKKMYQKNVGLCIVHRNYNYGGILQSYATVLKMEELGINYEIIDYRHPKTVKFYVSAFPYFVNQVTAYSKLRSLRRKVSKRLHPDYAADSRIREKKFEEFAREKFLCFSKPIRDFNELKEYAHKYTDIVVGSDQIWLPSGLGTNFYNLMFAPEGCNKIAYASSFGVSHIPKNQIAKTKEYLERIQHISVRETSGQRIIKDLTGQDVPVILDPTMIVTREQWDEHIPNERLIAEDYIFCYFLGNNPDQRREVLKLKEKTGLKIVTIKHMDEYIYSDEKFGDIAPFDIGPAEFINLVRHAKYVCTDSFHGSVYSIIYHKQFIAFNRFAEGANSRNSRLDTLFQNVGISRRFKSEIVREINEPIDYENVEKRLSALRSQANEYIVEALGASSYVKNVNFDRQEPKEHIICPDKDCTGCSVCLDACPQNAITMQLDNCGFWRPRVNKSVCIGCNNCNRTCPINSASEIYGPTTAFAYQNSDEVRFNSTSGGFFNAIAVKILDAGGVVCGAAFGDDMVLRHVFVDKAKELGPLQKSKYVQSFMGGAYKKIKDYLKAGRKVLYVGVGCQAAALRNYIGKNENLIIVDVVCYGVPSSGLFLDWINYLTKKYGKVVDVRFRDKSYGYASPNVKVLFENGKYIESCRDSNLYTDLFFRHLSIRESCYECHFKTIDRSSDITLGDLWSIEMFDKNRDDNKGTTVAFAHSVKGVDICKELGCLAIDCDTIINSDARKMVENVAPAANCSGFWRKYQEDGFDALISLYEKNTVKSKAKYLAKKIMNITGVSNQYYRKLKKHKVSTKTKA